MWVANLLLALHQIHFVHLRIHTAHALTPGEKLAAGRGFLIGQTFLMATLTVACVYHLFSWYAAMAFLPILFRGFTWFASTSEPLAIHALGWRELIHASVFGVLLVIGIELP